MHGVHRWGYQNERGAASCKPGVCLEGTYRTTTDTNSFSAATHCTGCRKGKYSNVPGLTSDNQCGLCSRGKYGDETGQTTESAACKLCVLNYFSERLGLAAAGDCVKCPSGQYGNSDRTKCSKSEVEFSVRSLSDIYLMVL